MILNDFLVKHEFSYVSAYKSHTKEMPSSSQFFVMREAARTPPRYINYIYNVTAHYIQNWAFIRINRLLVI